VYKKFLALISVVGWFRVWNLTLNLDSVHFFKSFTNCVQSDLNYIEVCEVFKDFFLELWVNNFDTQFPLMRIYVLICNNFSSYQMTLKKLVF